MLFFDMRGSNRFYFRCKTKYFGFERYNQHWFVRKKVREMFTISEFRGEKVFTFLKIPRSLLESKIKKLENSGGVYDT